MDSNSVINAIEKEQRDHEKEFNDKQIAFFKRMQKTTKWDNHHVVECYYFIKFYKVKYDNVDKFLEKHSNGCDYYEYHFRNIGEEKQDY